jgi:DNA-binding Xre family transcriptional regulator
MEAIKHKINKVLAEKGIKKQDFLNSVGISTSTFYDMIKKNNLSVDLIFKMSKALNVPTTFFFTDSNNLESTKEESRVSPNIREEYINSLIHQNEAMTSQISDLIKMQLYNAETIKNLTSK